jgi:hypothetical protein
MFRPTATAAACWPAIARRVAAQLMAPAVTAPDTRRLKNRAAKRDEVIRGRSFPDVAFAHPGYDDALMVF